MTASAASDSASPERGAERHRVGQHGERPAGRADLDGEQRAGGGRRGVHLVEHGHRGAQPVGDEHALVARGEDRTDRRARGEQAPHPARCCGIAHPGRHQGDQLARGDRPVTVIEDDRPSDAGPRAAGRGHAGRQHAEPAGARRERRDGQRRGVGGAQRSDAGLFHLDAEPPLGAAEQRGRAVHRFRRALAAPGRQPVHAEQPAIGQHGHLGGRVADVDPGDDGHRVRPRRV